MPPHVSWKDLDGLIVVVNVQTGDYYSLNPTASAVWRVLADGGRMEDARKALSAGFEVSQRSLGDDLGECVTGWVDEGLLIEPEAV